MSEHNHGKLWQGYTISCFVFAVAVFLAITSMGTDDFFSELFVLAVSGMLLIASFLMFKGVLDKKKECPICRS